MTQPRGLLERATVAILGVVVVGFGIWTLLYQTALAADLGSTPTLAACVVLTVPAAWFLLRGAVARPAETPAPAAGLPADGGSPLGLPPVALAVTVVVAAALVVLGALGQRPLMMVGLVVGAAAALLQLGVALRRRGARGGEDRAGDGTSDLVDETGGMTGSRSFASRGTLLWVVAWLWGLACAVIGALSARPDGDDAYFLNLTEWVADRGDFPTRDTMLSDERFPALAGHSPPVHSIEGLVGAVGHVTGKSAGLLTYVVAVPVLSLLAVLALAWLVSLSRIRFAPLGLSAAVVFLLASGGAGASYGNFFILRIWQGKATLLSLMIPLAIGMAVVYVSRGGWRRLLLLVLAVVCTVGASNTAVFLVPVLLAGVVVGAFATRGPRRAAGAAIGLAYPVLCGLVVLALAPAASAAEPSEDTAGGAVGLVPLVAVPGHHGLFVATLTAVVVGWLGLRSMVARGVALGLVLATSLALLPPVTTLLGSSVGVGSVLWRMWWVVPVPLLVAGVVGAAADLVPRARSAARPLTAFAVAAAMALVPLVGGRWLWDPDNGTRWIDAREWKVPVGAEQEARLALKVSKPGDTILAPWDTSRVLSGMSVDVHPVSARAPYLSTYKGDPAAHAEQRSELQRFADGPTPPADRLRPLVDVLSVDTVCVSRSRGKAVRVLEELGFTVKARKEAIVCLRK